MLWADSTEHLKEKEESSNQYSRLDARHLPTLHHSWCLQRPVMWFKGLDKNSVTCKIKGKFLGFPENISYFLRQSWKAREKDFSPALLKFFKHIHYAKLQWMGPRRHTQEVFLALSSPKPFSPAPFPTQPAQSSAPGEQLDLLSMFLLGTQWKL